MRLSQAGKLSCLLEDGTSETYDGGVNVCRRVQGGQVECGDVHDYVVGVEARTV